MTLRLDATYVPGDGDAGTMHLRLVNQGQETLARFRLAFTSVVQLTPDAGGPATLAARTSGYHELSPPAEVTLGPGDVWDTGPLRCGHRPGHANDGPASAFAILADGSIRAVDTGRTAAVDPVRVGPEAPPPFGLSTESDVARSAWAAAAECERRLFSAGVLGESGAELVTASVDSRLPVESFAIEGTSVAAGSEQALVTAFLTLARGRRNAADPTGV